MVAQRHKDRDGIVCAIDDHQVSISVWGCTLEIYEIDFDGGIRGGTKIPPPEQFCDQGQGKIGEIGHTVNMMCRDME